ncbi:DUF934 domain-containing protein [Jeongeupia chitinilytica]|uniref:DUF934 domain-containing protein n=1 Tax=Jeongeupia chitinilytica TaxID=1041641 RepID=A0ABQ3GXV8_9NEIS|nr:DUF934 domain-containing protein [Jeongeupia chitinilytica]GHD58151.1 hypothetical protein GCM10007350_07610 [Jeongeupia chitinilytica]
MPKLIIDRQIVDNTATLLRSAEDGAFAAVPAQGTVIVPLAQYLAQKTELNARGDVGVWFAPDDEPELLGADAAALSLIAVEFPAFTDGRGFSIGRLLRERYGFTGELRAFGDVFKDTLNYLTRCGFNAFVIREDKDIGEALKGLDDFTESYQSSVAQPMPLFRRRHAS